MDQGLVNLAEAVARTDDGVTDCGHWVSTPRVRSMVTARTRIRRMTVPGLTLPERRVQVEGSGSLMGESGQWRW